MDKNKHLQFDFFSQAQHNKGDTDNPSRSSVYEIIRRYEKGLLLAIAVVIIASIAYTIGMEHGKQRNVENAVVSSGKQAVKAVPVESERAVAEAALVEEVQQPAIEAATGAYTIQLASYVTESYAQREADKLKKKGYTPMLEQKGKYWVLSAGKFSSKEAAQRLLKEQFEERYTGCFARRL